jgi:hypothetical protein
MLAFPDMVHLFAYEFSGLGAGSFSLPRIFAGSFNGFLFWHEYPFL